MDTEAEEAANLRSLNRDLEEEPFEFTIKNFLSITNRGAPTIDEPEPEEPETEEPEEPETEEPNIPVPVPVDSDSEMSEVDEPGNPDVVFRF